MAQLATNTESADVSANNAVCWCSSNWKHLRWLHGMASSIIFSEVRSLCVARSRKDVSPPTMYQYITLETRQSCLSALCSLYSKVTHEIFFHLLLRIPCWEMVLHGSLTFLYISWAEALAAFVLNYLLEDFCIVKSFGRYCICLWSKGQIC